jgi:LuxR family maltose regulon positive regulatory protein
MLETLERGNVFVVPLDDRRQWYRYHHLFAAVLQTRLLDEQPAHVPELRRRASVWYEQNGEPGEAIHYALAAEDFARAADLIEPAVPAMRRSRQEMTLLGWLRALPDALVRARPVLSAHYAGTLLSAGELDGVETRLRDAERWLETAADVADVREEGATASTEMVVVNEEEFRRLPGSIAVWRAGQALILGDVAGTVRYAQRALDLLPADDHLGRGAAAALLGLASWTSGDLESAHRMYAAGRASLQQAGHIADALGCTIALADIRIGQGRLQEAMRTYEQALELATEPGGPVLRGTADMLVGMSELYRERGDLSAAMQQLVRAQELGEHTGLPQYRYRWRAAMARIREAEGDVDDALALLDEAERLYVGDFFPNVRPIAARKARVLVRQGRLGEAFGWAREHGISADDDLSYLREFEHMTLARLLLAESADNGSHRSMDGAMALLERLLHAAEDGGRVRSVIEILILQALALQAQRAGIPAALGPLDRALSLAEPEGYVRLFVDEGPPMAVLLEAAAKHGIARTYVRQLLASFDKPVDRAPATAKQGLIEPLSERELEVLRLLGTDLDGPEIARELVVSLNTMRTHTKSIYSKLGVNNRRAAVRRAEELELLRRTGAASPRSGSHSA